MLTAMESRTRATFRKDRRINIRISEKDLFDLQQRYIAAMKKNLALEDDLRQTEKNKR